MRKILMDKKKSILARLSFLFGLISIITLVNIFYSFLYGCGVGCIGILAYFGYFVAFFAVVFGSVSFLQIKWNNLGGKKLAIIGIILGVLPFILVKYVM